MKTIIRIEHNEGYGLWHSINKDTDECYFWEFTFTRELRFKHQNFPSPSEEGLSLNIDQYCAFKSIEQIQEWIEPEWFKEIIECGFKIWMIDVDDWVEGAYQILFRKEDIISKKDITSLFINKLK